MVPLTNIIVGPTPSERFLGTGCVPGYFRTLDSNIPILNPSFEPIYRGTNLPTLRSLGKNILICAKYPLNTLPSTSSHSNAPRQSSRGVGFVPHLCLSYRSFSNSGTRGSKKYGAS